MSASHHPPAPRRSTSQRSASQRFASQRCFPLTAILAATATLALLIGGCDKADNGAEEAASAVAGTTPAPKDLAHYFALTVGDRAINAQIALRMHEQQRGLMGRTELPPDSGMLFVFKQPQQRGFWMRNTLIALDIAYIDPEGIVREIYQMYPGDLETTESRSDNIQFALEMKRGWFAANDITPGARLDLNAVAAAITARGMKPAHFGL